MRETPLGGRGRIEENRGSLSSSARMINLYGIEDRQNGNIRQVFQPPKHRENEEEQGC